MVVKYRKTRQEPWWSRRDITSRCQKTRFLFRRFSRPKASRGGVQADIKLEWGKF